MSAYKFEISPSTFDVRIYDAEKSDMSYIATASIRTNGAIGWVSQVSSPIFFEVVLDNLDVILNYLRVNSLEGAMNPVMIRALRMKVKDRAKLTIMEPHEYAGRKLPWVKVERKDIKQC